MTKFGGQLDDEGVELLNQSIQGLSKPRVEPDGMKDRRSAAVRQGQALKEVLRMFLDNGDAPTNGGERPHVTVTMRYNDLQRRIEEAVLAYGGPISAAEARRIACDAQIIPVVMGSESEVLDVGRTSRLFTPGSVKPSRCGTKAAPFPGVTGPSPGATRITWPIGFTTARPPTRTVFCCVDIIIRKSTKATGKSSSPQTASPEFIPPPWVDRNQKPPRNTANHLTTLLRT